MLTALLAKLEREQYETDAGYSPTELAYRNGFNARSRELLQWLRTEIALAEMRAFDVSDVGPA